MNLFPYPIYQGFPGGSAGRESACNVGDLGSIPGLGRYLGEGKATHSLTPDPEKLWDNECVLLPDTMFWSSSLTQQKIANILCLKIGLSVNLTEWEYVKGF